MIYIYITNISDVAFSIEKINITELLFPWDFSGGTVV